MKIFYMGLESYQARYTYQLTDWTKRAYDKRNIDYVIVPGDTIDDSEAIVTGQVLDAHGRSYFGMSQMMNLVKMLKAGEITSKDAIFFEDMFQPGMESLPSTGHRSRRLCTRLGHEQVDEPVRADVQRDSKCCDTCK